MRYENEIQWTVDQSRLTVTEKCESPFRRDYVVYELVNAYLAKLPHVSYRSLGLNYVVSTKHDNPARWLTQRFLKPGAWVEGKPDIVGLKPNFAVDAGDATCNLMLSDGSIQNPEGGQEKAVIINGNMHHAGHSMRTGYASPSGVGRKGRTLLSRRLISC